MFNIYEILETLRRPKILINAARIGLASYNRETDLRFVAKTNTTPSSSVAVEKLLFREQALEIARTAGSAAYNVQDHIRVLTALLAEARKPKTL